MLLLTGKIIKAKKVRSFFCLQDRRNSSHFFKLGRLAQNQKSSMLTTFFRSEGRGNKEGKLETDLLVKKLVYWTSSLHCSRGVQVRSLLTPTH